MNVWRLATIVVKNKTFTNDYRNVSRGKVTVFSIWLMIPASFLCGAKEKHAVCS